MICEQWFPTPIWSGNLKNITEQQFNVSKQYCLDCGNTSPGRVLSNQGGWQSEGLYFEDIQDTPLSLFFDKIDIYVKQAFLEMGICTTPTLDTIWINVNKKTDSNILHNHPESSLSGVFYLTANNSAIVFYRDTGIPKHHLKWLRSDFNTPLSYTTVSYIPKQGDFLIFPSWLEHLVEPSQTDEERISVAFNYGYP